MLTIVITRPDFFEGEAEQINALPSTWNADIIHLRKPNSTIDQCRALIEQIDPSVRSRLVLHDHHSLCPLYNLKGIHLNSRNPHAPANFSSAYSISRSCHSFAEVEKYKPQSNYVFLSPIFNSISKQGYSSAFSLQELQQASLNGIIDSKVIALGGLTPQNIPQLTPLHFGGFAFLGAAWHPTK